MSNYSSWSPIGWNEDTDAFDHSALTYLGGMPSPTDPPGGLELAEIVGDRWLRLYVWSRDEQGTVVLSVEAASILAAQLQEWVDRKRGVTRHEGIGEFHKDTSHNPEA